MSIDIVKNLKQNERIHYYRNVIENVQELIDTIEDTDNILKDEKVLSKWKMSSTKPHKNDEEPYKFHTYEFNEEKTLTQEVSDIDYVLNVQKSIYDPIKTVSTHYAETHNFTISTLSNLKINKSYPGKHLGPHADSHGNDNSAKISIVVFLNDNFDGGEMLFRKQKVMVKPVSGSILIYPSVDPFYHQPNLIKSGIKYTVTGFWF